VHIIYLMMLIFIEIFKHMAVIIVPNGV